MLLRRRSSCICRVILVKIIPIEKENTLGEWEASFPTYQSLSQRETVCTLVRGLAGGLAARRGGAYPKLMQLLGVKGIYSANASTSFGVKIDFGIC